MITNIVDCPGESARGTGSDILEPFPRHLGSFLLSYMVLIMIFMNLAVLLLRVRLLKSSASFSPLLGFNNAFVSIILV